jgi:DNA replication protein DnaC
MALTNSQHDAIMRDYNRIQTKNRHIQEERQEEVYRRCPELEEADRAIVELSAANARLIVDGSLNALENYKTRLHELKARRERLIEQGGFPADYLQPIYECAECHDTGYVNGIMCSCFRKKITDMFYKGSNLKNITSTQNFDTFSMEWYSKKELDPSTGISSYDNMRQVVALCHQFIDEFDTSYHNLLLYGATGVGKTFLTNCIAKELLDSSHSVVYLTAVEFFEAMADFNKEQSQEMAMESILDCDLLIIDDLGTELSNSFTNSRLFYCLNERILKKKAVIISTNLGLNELSQMYSDRIMSRITSVYTLLRVFGQDIRIQKRKHS